MDALADRLVLWAVEDQRLDIALERFRLMRVGFEFGPCHGEVVYLHGDTIASAAPLAAAADEDEGFFGIRTDRGMEDCSGVGLLNLRAID